MRGGTWVANAMRDICTHVSYATDTAVEISEYGLSSNRATEFGLRLHEIASVDPWVVFISTVQVMTDFVTTTATSSTVTINCTDSLALVVWARQP